MPDKDCPACDGTGITQCEKCNSNGWVDDPSDGGYMNCPECDGAAGNECEECAPKEGK